MTTRPYDIMLIGATGFTARLVAARLAEKQSPEGFRFAIAGRSIEKLEQLRQQIGDMEMGCIRADSGDLQSLEAMTAQATILINTAGPFNWYGESVVKACITTGTHYLDITGEPAFVHQVYSRYHQEAQQVGVCLVNCCGFDSIPADLATWLTARSLPRESPKTVRTFLRTNATFSGGTWTTAIHAIYRRTVHREERLSSGPRHPDTPRLDLKIHFSRLVDRWAIPMPVVDPHIVKRSARQLPDDYGEAFAYGQFFTLSSFWKVVRLIVPIAAVFILVRFAATRNWLFNRFRPGTGPSAETRSKSRFEVRAIGQAGKLQMETIVSGGDPGYDETAKMLTEAAFTMRDRLAAHRLISGVRTPVEALGMDLVDRLRKEGIRIETHPHGQ